MNLQIVKIYLNEIKEININNTLDNIEEAIDLLEKIEDNIKIIVGFNSFYYLNDCEYFEKYIEKNVLISDLKSFIWRIRPEYIFSEKLIIKYSINNLDFSNVNMNNYSEIIPQCIKKINISNCNLLDFKVPSFIKKLEIDLRECSNSFNFDNLPINLEELIIHTHKVISLDNLPNIKRLDILYENKDPWINNNCEKINLNFLPNSIKKLSLSGNINVIYPNNITTLNIYETDEVIVPLNIKSLTISYVKKIIFLEDNYDFDNVYINLIFTKIINLPKYLKVKNEKIMFQK